MFTKINESRRLKVRYDCSLSCNESCRGEHRRQSDNGIIW